MQRAVEAIDRDARAQLRLVEDILDVSRIVRGGLRLDTAELDLGLLAHDVLDSASGRSPPASCTMWQNRSIRGGSPISSRVIERRSAEFQPQGPGAGGPNIARRRCEDVAH